MSYVCGNDTRDGWGKRYFFTYYNDFDGNKSSSSVILEVAILAIIFLISIIANFAIAICIHRYPDKKTVTNSYILNLAAADILFSLTMPLVAYVRTTNFWTLGWLTCKLLPFTQLLSGIVLLWTLTLISGDRYRCIVVPPYRSELSNIRAAIYSLICWTLTAIGISPILFYFREQTTIAEKPVCTIVFPQNNTFNYSIFLIVPLIFFACALPMVILVFNYHKIFQKIISTKSTWASSCVMVSSVHNQTPQTRRQSEVSLTDIFVPWPGRKCSNSQVNPNGRHGSLTQHEEHRLNKHIKCVRVLFLNVVMVLIMWLPITVVFVLIFIDGSREDTNFFLHSSHFIVALIIANLNTVVNPLLFGVMSDTFRASLVRLCCDWSEEHSKKPQVLKENTVTPSTCRNVPTVAFVNLSSIAVNSSSCNKGGRDRRQSLLNSISDFN